MRVKPDSRISSIMLLASWMFSEVPCVFGCWCWPISRRVGSHCALITPTGHRPAAIDAPKYQDTHKDKDRDREKYQDTHKDKDGQKTEATYSENPPGV